MIHEYQYFSFEFEEFCSLPEPPQPPPPLALWKSLGCKTTLLTDA